MTYFLPSYFQKRLLRYALARLDYLESDALDLENLDITFGQRSVVELKNAGIKVHKIIDTLQLPSSIRPARALIQTLRLTIPADLHVSGILVEVNGVEIEVVIDPQQLREREQKPRGPEALGGSHKPKSKSHVTGLRNKIADELPSHAEYLHAIPSSGELAMSFLQTETEQEKRELQAVIESQSTYLQQSTSSLDSSMPDIGTGLPGGFALPAFVANFFAGVADRLSVEIKNVTLLICTDLATEPGIPEPVKIRFTLEELRLRGLSPEDQSKQRSIEVHGFKVCLLSDPESFSQRSVASSPRISRTSTSKSAPKRLDTSTHERKKSLRSSRLSEGSSNGSMRSGEISEDFDLHLSEQSLEQSQMFEPSLRDDNRAAKSISQASTFASHSSFSRTSSGDLTAEPQMSISRGLNDIHQSPPNQLAESQLFSHDEAASMYMSAIGSTHTSSPNMPGGWDAPSPLPELVELHPKLQESQVSTEAESPTNHREEQFQDFEQLQNVSQPTSGSPNTNGPASEFSENTKLIAKRLVAVEGLIIHLPERVAQPTEDLVENSSERPNSKPEFTSTTWVDNTQDSVLLSKSTLASHGRTNVTWKPTNPASGDRSLSKGSWYSLKLTNLQVSLDISVCHLTLKTISAIQPLLQSTETQGKQSSHPPPDLGISLSVDDLFLEFYESLPGTFSHSNHAIISDTPSSLPAQSLLMLQLTRIKYEHSRMASRTYQRLNIQKIRLKCGTENIISFFDSTSLQGSFVAMSTLVEPDDVAVQLVQDRYEVALKPMHIKLDLLLMDDVLSRSGGLSSLLDLTNSVVSTGTVKDTPTMQEQIPKQRTVRFQHHETRSRSESDPNLNGLKVNLRIAGSLIDLIGSETSIQLKSSSIKLVLRPSRFRTNVSAISIKGPLQKNTSRDVGINITLSDLQCVYLDTPQEEDLDRLLSLLTPSSDKYDQDDDIMIETLLRQRRKGGVIRVSANEIQVNATGISWQNQLMKVAEEASKLSSVTKYLPEDDRPGILTFVLIDRFGIRFDLGNRIAPAMLKANLLEGAHISVPSLMAAQISSLSLSLGDKVMLVKELIPNMQASTIMGPPMLMCRFIADEMEPTVKVKLSNSCFEYSVPILLQTTQFLEVLQTDLQHDQNAASLKSSIVSSAPSDASDFARKVQFSLTLRNTALALNPAGLPSQGLFVLSDAVLGYHNKHKTMVTTLDLKKGSILIIDDVTKMGGEATGTDPKLYFDQNDQVQELAKAGFVPVGSISAAAAEIKIKEDVNTQMKLVDVEFRNNLLLLETCADSTQTLIQILSSLSPPTPPSKVEKYRTEIVPIQDMLSSFTGNAFISEPGPELGLQASQVSPSNSSVTEHSEQDNDNNIEEDDDDFMHNLYASRAEDEEVDHMTDSYIESEIGQEPAHGSFYVAPVNVTAEDSTIMSQSVLVNSLIDFRDDHFSQKTSVGGTAHRWNLTGNTYGMGDETSVQQSPLKVKVRDVHVIWNLFDGYDWQSTRETISQAVQDIETRAIARQSKRDNRRSPGMDEEEESVVGDVLFNSIYISIPANRDHRELTNAINHDLGDNASETGSYATSTTITATTSRRQAGPRPRHRKLRLNRSKQHKLTFELEGLSTDFLVFPPTSGEIESSVDIRVRKLEIFDHVPTSTWKKFATYMHEAGEREVGIDMVHIEMLNVKPIPDLAASEIVMKVTVLPLRLHVDQDALDFMTRFFEFKEEKAIPSPAPSNPPFLQRVEVNPIKVRLDFKPKRVDYAGLKSGRTTEFMNFFILDRSDMILRRVILYGVSGFDRLGIMLNNIWMPDVKKNQLPGVLAGLAPIRSLVDVGSGVKDLVAIPIREYKKDGRIVRSIQKGALAFAKTTSTELINLGAKLAIGTQTVLQNAEDAFNPKSQHEDEDEDMKKQISLYADQPLGIVQGLRGAYASLERDLLLAKDAIVAVPGEIIETGSAAGAAKVVLKQSPTIILRPAIGVTKAVGQALLGAGNTLDKGNRRRIEDKYKRY